MSSNQSQITCRCETLGHKCFVGRVVSDQGNGMLGKTVFLDQIIPGEEAHIEIVKDKRNYAHGSVLAVLSESSERVKPPCEYFDACGGCDMQHIDVAAQRKFKREFVESSLLKKFGSLPKRGVVLAGEGLPSVHYRNRIQLHIDADGNTGFYRRGSRSIVAISKCLIADRSLNEAIEKIQRIPKKELAAAVCIECLLGESVMVIVHPRRSHRQLPAHGFPLLKKQFPDLQIMSKSPGAGNVMSSFAQVNMEGNKVLQACVRDLIEGKQI
ncbi:MAG: class I SAM-dependent RNA methyltransferase, partial [Bdellovibrionales bacterium]|nr:class I SAM-dependent RNA methyltransferase [Bdellovibrionales bacterium]